MEIALVVICQTVRIYLFIMLARAILSFVPLFKPGWQPPAAMRPVVELIFGVTEPPLQGLRRVIPQPMGVPLDLSFLVLYILVGIVLPRVLGCR